ncbi:Ppx/GppA phosphatase family protein [Nonomuraea roseoviolacea]|uniref:Exopolyphosphatase/guanosine-5'-triphosphate, 3'-diphosphate pyrophosphatase n=1 Tax=Nonomuraea roseoviolacea subsp. carminata TaxID=160689 RepID=A0ABT1KEB9_9ACTN|nr:Ppx/GppA phosphatase family protein [Nonomuraea roseoviolacea]MCP2352350.1 exopolyphosphatase/guanosine-5'-triphosphate,3'-diphosphate pyrophosphatase [Nonomuraea roseoviolacea subsp. carminata]
MRLGVLDIGSNTVHLLVVDAHRGARPLPAYSHKEELRLTEYLDARNELSAEGIERLGAFVEEALRLAEDKGVEDFLAFATSAVREAANGEQVLARIDERCGVDIDVLSGRDEARLTFLAVRRWFGWSAGRLLVFDIGGGSLEIAAGVDEEPDVAVSLPLGAGRLTRDWFTADPPPADEVRALRRHVRAEIARTVRDVVRNGESTCAVATSKTFKQLARVAGAAPSSEGVYASRSLSRQDLAHWAGKLTTMDTATRAALPGVSPGRAAQLAAGALVADAAMDLFEVDRLEVCPWALREGVILRRLDQLPGRETPPA